MAVADGALLTALVLAWFIVRMHHRRDGASESEIEKQVKTYEKEKDTHEIESAIYNGAGALSTAAN